MLVNAIIKKEKIAPVWHFNIDLVQFKSEKNRIRNFKSIREKESSEHTY